MAPAGLSTRFQAGWLSLPSLISLAPESTVREGPIKDLSDIPVEVPPEREARSPASRLSGRQPASAESRQPAEMCRSGVVVVTRDSASPLRVLLPQIVDGTIPVVVVDNQSSDDSVEIAEAAGARVVRMPANAGYSAACNAGARALGAEVDWIAFVNPDVSLSAEHLRQLTTDVPDEIWAVAPLTVAPDGKPVADVARPAPTPWFVAAMYLGLSRSQAPLKALFDRWDGRYYYVEALSGSCLLIRHKHLIAIGGWDDAFFFNCEDIDICVRLAAAGGRVAVDRSVQVTHEKEHSSSYVSGEARRLECARAYATYFQIHGSRSATALVAISAFSGCLARHLVERLRPRPSPKAVASLRYSRLWGVLWSTVRQSYRNRPPVRPARAEFLDP